MPYPFFDPHSGVIRLHAQAGDNLPPLSGRTVGDPEGAEGIGHSARWLGIDYGIVKGTGRRCNLEAWQVMGKTGTAQVPRKARRGYEPDAYLASFIAAAPARDPAVVVLVMIRKPKQGGYYGGIVALPAVRTILEQTLPYLGVPPDKKLDADGRLVWDGG